MSGDHLPGQHMFQARLIADANDTNGRLSPDLDLIPQIGRTIVPTGWMPWLLRDAGLERLMPYVDWPTLHQKGPAWLRIRGTAQASIDALEWIGWNVSFEYGAGGTRLYDHYQIHLDRVPWRAELERLIAVEMLAKSTDSKFFRLVSGYDVRPVRGGHSRFGRSIFGRHSGVDVRPDWPRLSFKVHGVMHWPSSTKAHTSETLTVLTYAVRRGDIVHGRSRFARRATRGPIFGIQLSESTKGTAGVGHRAVEMLRPLAGIVGGRSIHGRRQAVFIGMRKVLGQHARFGHTKIGSLWRLATVEQLLAVREPISIAGMAGLVPSAASFEALTDVAQVERGDGLVLISDAPDGEPMIAAFANLSNAPWSGLPWGDDGWGTSPRVLATDELVET
jgi:hypothetical protein